VNFFRERKLSQAASDLVEFDAASIRQVVSSQHLADPDIWLVDPDAYEKNGRVLRDSESARMLAYSTSSKVLYATDGCNSCTRHVGKNLGALSSAELHEMSEQNEIRWELLEELLAILRNR
jgi:hypothetical protein